MGNRNQSVKRPPALLLYPAYSNRDGTCLFAGEKERLTRRKHDGGDTSELVSHALDSIGARLEDVRLVVSNNHHFRVAPFEKKVPWAVAQGSCPESYASEGNLLPGAAHAELSHHLAHAWSAAALAPFDSGLIVVMVRSERVTTGGGGVCCSVGCTLVNTEPSTAVVGDWYGMCVVCTSYVFLGCLSAMCCYVVVNVNTPSAGLARDTRRDGSGPVPVELTLFRTFSLTKCGLCGTSHNKHCRTSDMKSMTNRLVRAGWHGRVPRSHGAF